LFDIFMEAHRLGGWMNVNEDIVRDVIARATRRDTFAIAVIPGPTCVEGVIAFQPVRQWYGNQDSWYWSELLLFVRVEYRKSRHAWKLLQFAKWFQHAVNAPVMVSLMPKEDFDRKERLLGRFGKRVASSFLINV
jgi:hypothetical protein